MRRQTSVLTVGCLIDAGRLIRFGWRLLARVQVTLAARISDGRDNSAARVTHAGVGDDGLIGVLESGLLRQVDDRTCGAASLIVARMLLRPAYARTMMTGGSASTAPPHAQADVRSRFAEQSRLVHARTNRALGRIGARGFRVRLPWPRALGTPPWGVRDELWALADSKYRTLLIDSDSRNSRARAFAALTRSVGRGLPAALFTGNDLSPRHVVLIIGRSPGPDSALQVFDPGRGVVVWMNLGDFEGRLGDVAWTRPWAVVVPVR